jgi:hypothetical protein
LGAESDDVGRTLDYGRGKVMLKLFGLDLLFMGMGAFLLYVANTKLLGDDSLAGGWDGFLGGASLLLGLAYFFRLMRQTASTEPLLRLSPAGARLNIDGKVFVDVPWSEVGDVTALDVEGRKLVGTTPLERMFDRRFTGYHTTKLVPVRYDDVTALHVTKAFYDEGIAPRLKQMKKTLLNSGAGMARQIRGTNALMETGLGNIFVLRNGERYVLLHHAILPVSRETLRAAVEDRWRAFHGKARPAVEK